MTPQWRGVVLRLCLEGESRRALEYLRGGMETRAGGPPALPSDRIEYFRWLGNLLASEGRLRAAAAAHWRALRILRDQGKQAEGSDWGPLASIYRTLWCRTGHTRYHSQYLRFTREQSDAKQTALAAQALACHSH